MALSDLQVFNQAKGTAVTVNQTDGTSPAVTVQSGGKLLSLRSSAGTEVASISQTGTVNGVALTQGGVALGTAAFVATTTFETAGVLVVDAVLAAGASTVLNANITANTVVRFAYKTVGGTPGAVFVSARTAGVSLVVSSTSALDTSTVQVEVLSW